MYPCGVVLARRSYSLCLLSSASQRLRRSRRCQATRFTSLVDDITHKRKKNADKEISVGSQKLGVMSCRREIYWLAQHSTFLTGFSSLSFYSGFSFSRDTCLFLVCLLSLVCLSLTIQHPHLTALSLNKVNIGLFLSNLFFSLLLLLLLLLPLLLLLLLFLLSYFFVFVFFLFPFFLFFSRSFSLIHHLFVI